jgi:hypothetical protein
VNFWAEADGEFLDLHAQLPRDPEMSKLVDENGRAKQRQHGGSNVNDVQNGHDKNLPLQLRDNVSISGKSSPAITERKESLRAVYQGEKRCNKKSER